MKIYQCFHKFSPQIPYFEDYYKIKEQELSFNQLRKLILEDGYSSSYILKPALEGNEKDFFFTIWDYKTLQFKWAEENGLKTKDLSEIKLAQIEEFKPDVFYNHSPYYDNSFIDKIKNKKFIKACWDAIISPYPSLHEKYDIRFTLFEPYVKYWHQKNMKASILSPAFDPSWEIFHENKKEIDILFYGQYNRHFFSKRNKIIIDLLNFATKKGYDFHLHLMYNVQYIPLINLRGFNRISKFIKDPPKIIREKSLAPIHGKILYSTIGKSKIVVNAFGNFNGFYQDNMRNYETIGCGAVLISQDGIYPDHFEHDKDFLTYKSTNELFENIEFVLSLPDQGLAMAKAAYENLKFHYSKENQWNHFVNNINSI